MEMKNKIEVGEYIRTKSGKIYKIDKIEECSVCFEPLYVNIEKIRGIKFTNSYHIKDIKKHSKNIIDLIEVGDIVIGKDSHLFEVYAVGSDCVYINNLEEFVCVQDIKSIVTKEQMKEMEYRV